jgi:membrane-associated phospholipid phosphatase
MLGFNVCLPILVRLQDITRFMGVNMFDFWRLPVVKLCFACAAGVILVVGLWAPYAHFKIDVSSFRAPALLLPLYGTFMLGSWAIFWRLSDDQSRIAGIIKYIVTVMYDHAAVIVFMLLYAPVSVLFSYLMTSTGLPMQDAMLSSIDRALGFNWDALLVFVNSHPTLGLMLTLAYKSAMWQMAAVFALLVFTGRIVDLWDFIAMLTLGSVASITVSGLVPAIAAYTYYGADPSHYAALEQIWPTVGRLHVEEVLNLHSGLFTSFEFGKNHGLVTFPSYHTLSAIAMVYAVRSYRLLFWPVAALNAAVIFSTLPIGGHYLADVIGGIVVALASIALIEKLNGRASMWTQALPWCAALARLLSKPLRPAAGSA